MADYDVREVLETYVAVLSKAPDSVIRDVEELPHPKDIIKFALQHCIRTAADDDTRAALRRAYLSLGGFQALSGDEKSAVALLNEVGPPAKPGSELHSEQAERINHVAGPLQAVMERLQGEFAVLMQDLKSLPGAK